MPRLLLLPLLLLWLRLRLRLLLLRLRLRLTVTRAAAAAAAAAGRYKMLGLLIRPSFSTYPNFPLLPIVGGGLWDGQPLGVRNVVAWLQCRAVFGTFGERYQARVDAYSAVCGVVSLLSVGSSGGRAPLRLVVFPAPARLRATSRRTRSAAVESNSTNVQSILRHGRWLTSRSRVSCWATRRSPRCETRRRRTWRCCCSS